MCRNDCRLTCWNRNCDIPIRFRTPVCQINENRQISAESQHNFHFLPHLISVKMHKNTDLNVILQTLFEAVQTPILTLRNTGRSALASSWQLSYILQNCTMHIVNVESTKKTLKPIKSDKCKPISVAYYMKQNRKRLLRYGTLLAHLTNIIKLTFAVFNHKIFWWVCFAPPHLLRPAATIL